MPFYYNCLFTRALWKTRIGSPPPCSCPATLVYPGWIGQGQPSGKKPKGN